MVLPTFRRYPPVTTLYTHNIRVNTAHTPVTTASLIDDLICATTSAPKMEASDISKVSTASPVFKLFENRKSELASLVLLLDVKLSAVLGYCNY
jgi:hypothetical protein